MSSLVPRSYIKLNRGLFRWNSKLAISSENAIKIENRFGSIHGFIFLTFYSYIYFMTWVIDWEKQEAYMTDATLRFQHKIDLLNNLNEVFCYLYEIFGWPFFKNFLLLLSILLESILHVLSTLLISSLRPYLFLFLP